MPEGPDIARIAAAIADQARSEVLATLMADRALTASELGNLVGVSKARISAHLRKLVDAGLVAVERQGRHRYFRLADAQVAVLLEHLAAVGSRAPVRRKPLGREAQNLRFARCCYDHLAGQVGVAITERLTQSGLITAEPDKRFAVTPAGMAWFGELGLDVATLKPGRHGIARQCLDWTERQHHLAGPLGVALLALLCDRGWMRRTRTSRAVQVTPRGRLDLRERLGLTPESLAADAEGPVDNSNS
jgi:DNA-binding transcriptional ArsR family regulator